MTARLQEALQTLRRLRGRRVLCEIDGSPLTQKVVQNLVRRAARRADLSNTGVHVLRHTFCSHLSMQGGPVRAIQVLAGHAHLTTTQRYMHLSPAAIDATIRLLEGPKSGPRFGDIVGAG
jgi:site-specific recombinase XerD